MGFFRKLFIGRVSKTDISTLNPIKKRILNIKSIWDNDHNNDNGIEKIFRLFLSITLLLFPGIYLKAIASKISPVYKDLAMDFYILMKVIFPILILYNHWQEYSVLVYVMIYLLMETALYIPTLIFASDLFSRPRSYKRSMLMLFFNYVEIVIAFGVLYTLGQNLNKPFEHWFDPIYFSVVSSNSIGFGDYYPITTFGKVLVTIQAMFFLSFVILFLNFFTTKVKSKGYFDSDDID